MAMSFGVSERPLIIYISSTWTFLWQCYSIYALISIIMASVCQTQIWKATQIHPNEILCCVNFFNASFRCMPIFGSREAFATISIWTLCSIWNSSSLIQWTNYAIVLSAHSLPPNINLRQNDSFSRTFSCQNDRRRKRATLSLCLLSNKTYQCITESLARIMQSFVRLIQIHSMMVRVEIFW